MEQPREPVNGGDSKRSPVDDAEAAAGERHGYRDALAETRRVIDVQVQMAEDADEEILTVIRIAFLSLGGVVTLIAYVPRLVAEALPWIAVATTLLVTSILLSAYIYRGITLYAGFGDHGYDRHAPRQKLKYEFLIDPSDGRSTIDDLPTTERHPSAQAVRSALLNEHQAGISHNNVEIKYRSQLHQQTILLLVTAVLLVGVGLSNAILGEVSTYTWVAILGATAVVLLISVYTVLKSIGLVARFIQTDADPDRLTYGYGFERKYPYLSRVCAFVTTYLYDPADGEW